MYEALRKGAEVKDLHEKTYIKPWFIEQMKELVELEEKILAYKDKTLPDDLLIKAKKDGFADRYLAMLLNLPEKQIREQTNVIGHASRPGSRFLSAVLKMQPIIIPPIMHLTRYR